MKRCRQCRELKPLDEFYARASSSDGHQTICAKCTRAAAKLWATANHERKLANMAKWRAENAEHRKAYKAAHREREAETKRERYWRDIDESRKKETEFRATHRENCRDKTAKWIARNQDKVLAHRATDHYKIQHCERERRRNALKRATAVESVDYHAILAEFGMMCHICGESIVDRKDLHFDHVVPIALGGPHIATNIRPSHARCNLKKAARPIEEVPPSA